MPRLPVDPPSTNSRLPRWYYGWNIIATAMTFQAIAFGLTIYTFGLWVTPLGEETR